MAKLAGRVPNLGQFLVLEHAVAGLFASWALDPDARVNGNELLTPRPVEQLVENGMQPVCQNWRVRADAIEDGNDVSIGDVGEATAPPPISERKTAAPALIPATVLHNPQWGTFLRRDRGLGIHRETEQSRRPLPATVTTKLIFLNVAPSDCLETVVHLRVATRHHLLVVRVATALDLGAQPGGFGARVLERDRGIAANGVLDRLATVLAAIA